MDSAMDHQNDQGRSTSPVNDTSTSNTNSLDFDNASRDSKLHPATEDGDIIPDLVPNEVTEQDTSPKIITSSNNHGPAELTSSLMDAQPNSADEDWGHIPALIPQPLKTGKQTTQAQEQHPNDMPTDLVQASDEPAPNAFSDKALEESTEKFTNDRAQGVLETQPVLQAPSAAQLDALQGTSSQNEEFTSDIPHMTYEVPQNQTEDQVLAQLRLQLRLSLEEKALRREVLQSAQVEGAEKVGSPEQASVAEDADKIDSEEAIGEMDTPLEGSKDEDALVVGLQNLQIDTSGSGVVLEEAAASPIMMQEESSDDLVNEHGGTLHDDGKEASTVESPASETFVVGEADDAEESRPQHHPEEIKAIAVAKDGSKDYHQSPANNDSALESSNDEEEADAQETLSLVPEHIEAIAIAKDDTKENHQSPTEDSPSSKTVSVGEADDAEESRPQHYAEDIKATAVANDNTEEHHHSPANNNPSLETSNDEADLNTQNSLSQHTEAATAVTNDASKQYHQPTIHAPPPNAQEAAPTKEPPLEQHLEGSEEDPKSLDPAEVEQADEPSPVMTTVQGIADHSTMANEAEEPLPHDITKAQEVSQKTEQAILPETSSPAENPAAAKGKKMSWMEKVRRLRFFAG